MPRGNRIVFAGVPHHVTQRGNRRERVFFRESDYSAYLAWLKQYTREHAVDVLAYCLMPNHVHLVVVPDTQDALNHALRPLHMRYAQSVNRARGWKGHLWQGRYFASALDEGHLWAAIRYVERNPVRARLVDAADCYPWSSASAHCGLWGDPVLSEDPGWRRKLEQIGNWSRWLSDADDTRCLQTLRHQVVKGLPCGSDAFIDDLEMRCGRRLRSRRPGRPATQHAPACAESRPGSK